MANESPNTRCRSVSVVTEDSSVFWAAQMTAPPIATRVAAPNAWNALCTKPNAAVPTALTR